MFMRAMTKVYWIKGDVSLGSVLLLWPCTRLEMELRSRKGCRVKRGTICYRFQDGVAGAKTIEYHT